MALSLLTRVNPDIMRRCVHDGLIKSEFVASPAPPLANRDHTGDASLLLHRVDCPPARTRGRHADSDLYAYHARNRHHTFHDGDAHRLSNSHPHGHPDAHRLRSPVTDAYLHASPIADADFDSDRDPIRHTEPSAVRHSHPT